MKKKKSGDSFIEHAVEKWTSYGGTVRFARAISTATKYGIGEFTVEWYQIWSSVTRDYPTPRDVAEADLRIAWILSLGNMGSSGIFALSDKGIALSKSPAAKRFALSEPLIDDLKKLGALSHE